MAEKTDEKLSPEIRKALRRAAAEAQSYISEDERRRIDAGIRAVKERLNKPRPQ